MTDYGERAECPRCHQVEVSGDLRTLHVACFYDLGETSVPWEHVGERDDPHYRIRVCKGCRGDFIARLDTWWTERPVGERPEVGSGIFVRRNGANVEITREEWDRLNPGREPVLARSQEVQMTLDQIMQMQRRPDV